MLIATKMHGPRAANLRECTPARRLRPAVAIEIGKQAVVGHGKAAKEQVADMVRRLLDLPGAPSPDAADALACAIAHAHGGQGFGGLATAGYRVRRGRLV